MSPPDRPKPPHLVTVTVEVPIEYAEKVRRFAALLLQEAREDYDAALVANPEKVTQLDAWKRKKSDEPESA